MKTNEKRVKTFRPNRSPKEEAELRKRLKKADEQDSFLFSYQVALGLNEEKGKDK